MNFIKSLSKLILTAILCGIFFTSYLNPKADNLDLDELSLDEIEKYEAEGEALRVVPPDPILLILKLILQEITEPLWKTTKPPKGRNILYLIPHKITAIEYGGIDLNLFFNKTNKMDVTFDSLIKLDDNLKKIIDSILNKISPNAASSLAPLLKKVTLQERRFGGLLQAGLIYKFFNFQLHSSIQLSERNFWLTKRDQRKIKEFFASSKSIGGGGGSSTTSLQFSKDELYKIKCGLGDTRAKAGLNALNTSNIQLDLGFEGIIPTAEKQTLPKVDHQYVPTEGEFTTWLIDNLNPIKDNLINPQLGNNGHWGLGFFIESKITLFHNAFNLWNRFSVDSFF